MDTRHCDGHPCSAVANMLSIPLGEYVHHVHQYKF